ncbi:hypothetical protein BDB00DRAFT_192475 [Zychaea mexicana]|uniref:uncharacterized protein n=1 Tax=Zychaea mexicana TaxID=64656 RepID=UPI0022FE12B1|nr:uncharacterized protein BDB00DRAFT_192475 [Zychaea mexicana]KAI9495767.1 hypothetical protein BDB00DRAFT_192475 [Zychaea mexicana]
MNPEEKSTASKKQSDTISRDIYALAGGAPPIAFVKPTFKAKYNTKQKATPWIQQSFTNPARPDDLALHHWIPESKSNEEYQFAKFNRVIDVPEYTDDDYDRYLSDSDWSKDETDYLFQLCRRFDLRFPVIEDRYNFANKSRSIEDLKDRYYTVQRKLIKARPHTPGEYPQERQALIQQYAYDKAKETGRKEALVSLFNRTEEQIEQEQALFVEAKRIELNEPRLAREREALLNALQLEQAQQAPLTPLTPTAAAGTGGSAAAGSSGGVGANNVNGSAGGATNASGGASGGTLATPGGIGIAGGTASTSGLDSKKKKRADETGTGTPGGSSSGGTKKNRRISNASSGILEDVVPERKEKMMQGVYVRSQKLPVVTKQALQQKLLKAMADLDIPVRPMMPTGQVVQKYDLLHHSLLHMLELKKTVDKLEAEHRSKMQRGQSIARKQPPSGGPRDKRRKQG